jgi:CheY-like chemotaxis protein
MPIVSKSLLIVDDNAYVRRALRQLASQGEFKVCGEAQDGKEAVQKAQELRARVDWHGPFHASNERPGRCTSDPPLAPQSTNYHVQRMRWGIHTAASQCSRNSRSGF